MTCPVPPSSINKMFPALCCIVVHLVLCGLPGQNVCICKVCSRARPAGSLACTVWQLEEARYDQARHDLLRFPCLQTEPPIGLKLDKHSVLEMTNTWLLIEVFRHRSQGHVSSLQTEPPIKLKLDKQSVLMTPDTVVYNHLTTK